jgi:hypothetical protein
MSIEERIYTIEQHLSFEEQYKDQNTHECYRTGYHEDLTPLELLFLFEFIHYETGELRPAEKTNAGL